MNFLELPERINRLLYKKEVVKLGRRDMELATRWTMEMIRDRNPEWSEEQVRMYYDRLLNVRVIAVDQWSRRFGEFKST